MLFLETVEPRTFAILKKLMAIEDLRNFSLVGRTNLSLIFGHRISIDLDLFCNLPFEHNKIEKKLIKTFGNKFNYEPSINPAFGIFCFIEEIKVDLIRFPHALISNINIVENIRMYGIPNIAAMKIQAILGRGNKKDFWDLAEIFMHYSLAQVITWHKEKFPNQMLAISIPNALTYFTEANNTENPVCLKGKTWEMIQTEIKNAVSIYLS